ncbi:zinc ribbon domain-containing protein [Metabacillus litoralis]|uniref:Zinc ribbon domain-containing protein n=1 Tax=Metabacillus litoralis TaxID=152268 RepID=A0A5C6VZC0_9BACI|nr:zinc ribbon domain-containing protein [Metabacillus litoralis]TXC90918.1 zinc ribbon domain-containing protein [Metabacillus litoralis]
MESRPNFYLLLDLPYDPPEENEVVIKQALDKKKIEWGKKRNHPRDAQKIKYYLGLSEQILDVMLDEDKRKEEATEAKEIAHKERLKKEKAINKRVDGVIKVLSAKGYITKVELASVEKDTKVAKDLILKRINVPIKDDKDGPTTSSTSSKQDVLNPEKIKQILHLLDQLDIEAKIGSIPTLYDLLEQPTTADIKTLSKLSQELYQRYQNKGVSTDAAEYKKQLYSIANGIFKNDSERTKYDNSLQEKRFETVVEYIKIASIHGKIDYTVYKELVKEAVNEGLGQDVAKDKIKSYCQQNGILLLTSNISKETELDLHQCHFCGVVNVKNSSHCKGCGYSLRNKCSHCQGLIESGSTHCTSCGQSVMGLVYHDKLLKEGYYALSRKNIILAEECFLKAEYNFKSQEVIVAQQKVSAYKKDIQQQIKKIEAEMKRKHYYQAEKELLLLKKLNREAVESIHFEREITTKLSIAENYLKQASAAKDLKSAASYYIEALDCSADCQRAREKLNQLPPDPAEKLECRLTSEAIALSWVPSPSTGELVYRIIRKEGAAPTHTQDGVMIGETSSNSFTDKDTEAGKQYFYALITKRLSAIAKAMTHGDPIMRMLEVENLSAKPENGAIKITWKAPLKTKIEVWKKENGIPLKRGDGTKLNGVKVNEVLDQDVSGDKQYGYLVICQYEDVNGKFILSNGKSVLTMALNIEPIVNILVKYQNQKALIKNNNVMEGEQIVYISQAPFTGFKLGDFYLYEQLKGEMNGNMQQPVLSNDWTEISLTANRPTYLLPVSKLGNAAVIGQQRVLKHIRDVSEISSTTDDKGDLYLKWNWPKDVEQVLVVYSEKEYPTDPRDAESVQRHCSKVSYEAFNGYKIDSIKAFDHLFITIYVGEELNGQTIYSEGTRYFYTNAKPIEIQYRVESKGFLKKKNVITINSSDITVGSPELIVVKQQGRQPLSKDDGTEIYVIPEGTDLSKYEIDLTAHMDRNAYFKLFYANQNDRTRFLLESIGELTTGK